MLNPRQPTLKSLVGAAEITKSPTAAEYPTRVLTGFMILIIVTPKCINLK